MAENWLLISSSSVPLRRSQSVSTIGSSAARRGVRAGSGGHRDGAVVAARFGSGTSCCLAVPAGWCWGGGGCRGWGGGWRDLVGAGWQVVVHAEGGDGGGGAGQGQRGEQGGALAGAERRRPAGGAEQEAGGEGQGAQAVVPAGGSGRGEGVDDRRQGRREAAP